MKRLFQTRVHNANAEENKKKKVKTGNNSIKKTPVKLTPIYPVRDTIKDLILFSIVGHLHSFSSYIGFEKNVVVWNISLQNKM